MLNLRAHLKMKRVMLSVQTISWRTFVNRLEAVARVYTNDMKVDRNQLEFTVTWNLFFVL
jgi:hypothetical protein